MPINDYATATEVANMMLDVDLTGSSPQGVVYATQLGVLATRASRAFDRWSNRKPGAYYVDTDVTRYPTYGNGAVVVNPFSERLGGGAAGGTKLWIGELAAAPTSVAVSLTGSITTYTAYVSTDYIAGPYNALDDGLPYEWLELDLFNGTHPIWSSFPKGNKIVGKFGYSATVPDDIKQAIIALVGRWYKRGKQGYQDRVNILDQATALAYLNGIDGDVVETLRNYKRQAL